MSQQDSNENEILHPEQENEDQARLEKSPYPYLVERVLAIICCMVGIVVIIFASRQIYCDSLSIPTWVSMFLIVGSLLVIWVSFVKNHYLLLLIEKSKIRQLHDTQEEESINERPSRKEANLKEFGRYIMELQHLWNKNMNWIAALSIAGILTMQHQNHGFKSPSIILSIGALLLLLISSLICPVVLSFQEKIVASDLEYLSKSRTEKTSYCLAFSFISVGNYIIFFFLLLSFIFISSLFVDLYKYNAQPAEKIEATSMLQATLKEIQL